MSRVEFQGPVVPGSAEIFSAEEQKANNKISPSERIQLTLHRNTPAYLQEHITSADNPRNVAWVPLGPDGAVQTINPLQAWREGGKMINAAPGSLLLPTDQVPTDETGRFPTQLIYEGEMSVQVEYARQLLGNIFAMEKAGEELYATSPSLRPHLDQNTPMVVVMENAMSQVSDRFVHSARTLATQHAQVLLNGFGVNTEAQPIFSPALQMEQQLKRSFPGSKNFIETIGTNLQTALDDTVEGVSIAPITVDDPLRYTIVTPITRDMPLEDSAAMLAQVMKAHYGVNKPAMTELLDQAGKEDSRFKHLLDKRGIKPFACRQTYYFLPDENGIDRLLIDESPAILGGGDTEDYHVAIDRGPQFEQLMPPDTRELFDKTFGNELEQQLSKSLVLSSQ